MPHPYERDITLLKQTLALTLDEHQLLTYRGPVMPMGAERERVKAQQVEQLDSQIAELQSVIDKSSA